MIKHHGLYIPTPSLYETADKLYTIANEKGINFDDPQTQVISCWTIDKNGQYQSDMIPTGIILPLFKEPTLLHSYISMGHVVKELYENYGKTLLPKDFEYLNHIAYAEVTKGGV